MSEKPYIPSLNEFLQNGSAYIAIRSFVKPILMPNYCKCYKLFSNNRCILTEQISNIVSLIVQYNLLDVTIVEYGSFNTYTLEILTSRHVVQYIQERCSYGCLHAISKMSVFQVIGNIHDNPELLGGNK